MRKVFSWLALLMIAVSVFTYAGDGRVYPGGAGSASAQESGAIEIVLTPDWPDVDPQSAWPALLVRALNARLSDLDLAAVTVKLSHSNTIQVHATVGSDELVSLLEAVSMPLALISSDGGGHLLEFVDFSHIAYGQIAEGACILTTEQVALVESALLLGEPEPALDSYMCPPQSPGDPDEPALLDNGQPFRTIMTGTGLASASVAQSPVGNNWMIEFSLRQGSVEVVSFLDYVASNANRPMGIVLDGRLISYPTIQPDLATSAAAGTMDGGIITGNFTYDEAQILADQLNSQVEIVVPLTITRVQYATDANTTPDVTPDKTG